MQRVTNCSGPVRVLFFDHTAELGGGEIALLNLLRYLDPAKVKPIVLLAAEGPLVGRLRPIAETHVLPLSATVAKTKKDALGFRSLFRVREILVAAAYTLKVYQFIRRHKIDLVHTNSLKADIIGGIAGRFAGLPVVWHVRDRIEDDYLPGPVVRIFRLLCRIVPTYLIANSAATFRTLHLGNHRHGTSIPSGIELGDRMAIVHDGTNTHGPRTDKADNAGSFRVGLIGRISPWKGQHIFIRAATLVNKNFPKARFIIIGSALFGEADYEREIRQLPYELKMDGLVEFAGFRPDIKQAIDELDLVVHASTTGEPFGQVIIEGMAAGKPVVATNGGGVPEIVEDGKTGILVAMGDVESMADAICQILADPLLAKQMGARGRERVAQNFTVEKTAGKVEAVYAEIFARNGSSAGRLHSTQFLH